MNIIPDITRIADHYGLHPQICKLYEELDELRGVVLAADLDLIVSLEIDPDTMVNLVDEMADVSIMVQQITYLTGTVEDVSERIQFKINRQLGRMSKEASE